MPLLDNTNTFEMFNISNMPVPVKDFIVQQINSPLWYRLETFSITVNLAQMKYVLFMATEKEQCTSSLLPYCDVRRPVYSMTSSKLCKVELFAKHTKNVKNYHKTEVEPNSILPTPYHVIDGL